jgi:hypothetical protein
MHGQMSREMSVMRSTEELIRKDLASVQAQS